MISASSQIPLRQCFSLCALPCEMFILHVRRALFFTINWACGKTEDAVRQDIQADYIKNDNREDSAVLSLHIRQLETYRRNIGGVPSLCRTIRLQSWQQCRERSIDEERA